MVDGVVTRWDPGPHRLSAGGQVDFPAGAPLPQVVGGAAAQGSTWAAPLSGLTGATVALVGGAALTPLGVTALAVGGAALVPAPALWISRPAGDRAARVGA